ncbi:helix-turn-helix domain-containing protein [Aquimarina sp. 2201CG5-10]|uniref:helix-turn-helix domain-containing protein n=1 Tax=Aquimarina callyspongiae TaxID=3098150 RepID=UPI002AB4C39E|nr:helix-turn-helix domain-containing protein [Aquimarina sp. 2201CG5-10]MDY8138126.1 helix-turn-helix domain-containing protein [Aquimarina sp. 2201CG5-10]
MSNSSSVSSVYLFRSVILCFSVFFSINVIGQQKETEVDTSDLISDELRLFISQSDSIKKIRNLITDALYIEKDTVKSFMLSKVFLDRGIKEDNFDIQYFSAYQIAYIEYLQSNHIPAIKSAERSLKAAQKLKDTSGIIGSNLMLGSSYYLLGFYEESIQCYLEAKKLSEIKENRSLQISSLTNIANNRLKLNRFKDALEGFNIVLDMLKETDENSGVYKRNYKSALLGKGKCLAELNRFEEALEVDNMLIKFAEQNNIEVSKGYAYINIGDVYYKKKEYHKALGFLNEGKEILIKNSEAQKTNLVIANFYIARCYYVQKEYQKTLKILDTNFSMIGENTDIDKIEDMYQLAIDTSKDIGDQSKQIFYYDKLQNAIKAKSDKQLMAKDLLYEDDIKNFAKRNEDLEKEKDKSILSNKVILLVSIGVFLILLFVFGRYWRKTKNNEKRFLELIKELETKEVKKEKKPIHLKQEIKDEKAKKILKELQDLENTHFYLSQDCNLYSTAKLLHTNTTYLSKALNERSKQSFNQYLNELRVNYVLLKLKEDPVFRSYTIRAVASEIGYKSHTTFIKVFKEKTGVTPSYYIKKLGLA